MPPGEEDAWNDPGPALFVKAIHQQQQSLSNEQKPLPREPRQIRREISIAGSPFLGMFKSKSAGQEGNVAEQKAQRLSFFANRDRERVTHQEKDFGGFHHEDL
ncbi:hypothetical protein FRC10_010940 [Ceratobasidium sp. 414]|nr:hypothetical protein FRC10_010940 [Ceratobasidium sp. 414]